MPIHVTVKIALITLCCFLFSCTPKAKVKEVFKPGFTNFEVTFGGFDMEGGMGQYSFALDSNKSFFVMSDKGRRVNYGILPDSVFKRIDSLIVKMISKKDTMIDESNFSHCGLTRYYAVVIKFKNDSLKITHWDLYREPLIYPLDRIIQKYTSSLPQQAGGGEVAEWETFRMMVPHPTQKFMEMLSKEK